MERGITCITQPNDEFAVRGVGFIASLNTSTMTGRSYHVDEKLLGFLSNHKFNICQEFKLSDGRSLFGYISKQDFDSSVIRVRLIEGFDQNTFDPYNSTYHLAEEIILNPLEVSGFFDDTKGIR